MGRRAKKQKVQTKKRPEVAKKFKCPFCNHDESVECKMKMSEGIGQLTCRVCGASYKMTISYLSEPIDVFYEWLDDCEAAAEQDDGRVETLMQHSNSNSNQGAANNKSISTTGGGDSDAEEERELLAAGYTKEELAKEAEKEAGQKRTATDLGFSDSDSD